MTESLRADSTSAESEGVANAESGARTEASAQNTDNTECSRAELHSTESERAESESTEHMFRVRGAEAKIRRLEALAQRQQAQLEQQAFQIQELMARLAQMETREMETQARPGDMENGHGSAQPENQRMNKRGGSGTNGLLVPDVQRQIPTESGEKGSLQTVRTAERPRVPREAKRQGPGEAVQSRRPNTTPGDAAPARKSSASTRRPQGQPRRPSSQGGEASGWAERQARVAEQHASRLRSAAERTAVERSAAERVWLACERAQGRNKKAAYARWREGRKAWLKREARKARRRRKQNACNEQDTALVVEKTGGIWNSLLWRTQFMETPWEWSRRSKLRQWRSKKRRKP